MWREWRPLFITLSSSCSFSVVCVSCVYVWLEQEVWFRCRMRMVNQTLRYHKQCDDITRGGGERKRLATLSALRCGGKAFLASNSQIRVCFHFHGKQSQNPTNNISHCCKIIYKNNKEDVVTITSEKQSFLLRKPLPVAFEHVIQTLTVLCKQHFRVTLHDC